MPIEIDEPTFIPDHETPSPDGTPVIAPDGDTCAPRWVLPSGTPLPPEHRPAMELTPERGGAVFTGVGPLDARSEVDFECPISNEQRPSPDPFLDIASLDIGHFSRASAIAAHLGVSVKTVQRQAKAEAWPSRVVANRVEFQPPFEMPVGRDSVEPSAVGRDSVEPAVTFTALSLSTEARARVLTREQAVKHFLALIMTGTPKERAYVATVSTFAAKDEPLLFSIASLRRWVAAYATLGLNGLVEQKQGVVGRKSAARFLTEDQTARLQAQTIEHGSKARAGRNLMRDPELHAGVRQHLHGAHTSKSYLPPSIRAAATTSPLTAALCIGPRAARMMTSSVHATAPKPGEVYVADDETPNIYIWEPWPNKLGYRIGRPQILQVADCGSLMPLVIRVIMRASGAYTADDVAGTLGDAFDFPGLPNRGLLLEGGVWRANTVLGHKTNLSVEERIGGLASLGLEIFHARTPSAKWQIEGQFHLQQHIMDACPGYCGRNERETLPEKTKKLLAAAECGKIHPSEFLLTLSKFNERVQDALREYSHECQDGKTLAGASPFEKWNEEKPALRHLAEKDKWLYRSAMAVVSVKKNGELRINHGSGKNMRIFYYHNPALLMPRAGQEVAVFWDDHNPESDCVILAGRATNPKQRICIGVAKYVREISRFDSTKAELGEAMKRKGQELAYAKTELRTIEPHLLRTSVPVAADANARHIGDTLSAAARRHDDQQKTKVTRDRVAQSAARFGASSSPSPSPGGEGWGEGGPTSDTIEILGAATPRPEVIEQL